MQLTEAQLAGLEKQLDQSLACTDLDAYQKVHIDWLGLKDGDMPPALLQKTYQLFDHGSALMVKFFTQAT